MLRELDLEVRLGLAMKAPKLRRLARQPESSVLYDMPSVVKEAGLSEAEAPLADPIARHL